MKKRIPLYELITKLDSREKLFIRKYITENLNASSKKSYLDFYDVLLKTNQLTDNQVLSKLTKNKLKDYLSEAKFYLNKLIIKALRIHYTVNSPQKNETDNFLSNLEKQKEIYIYFSKGLYKDAAHLCKKYAKEWEEKEDFAMLSFTYKKMHQIELITGTNQTNSNQYFELYTKLHQSNNEKSKYYHLALKVETDLQKIEQVRSEEDIKTIKKHLYSEITLNKNSADIYYWYIKILCHFALLNFESLMFCFIQIDTLIKKTDLKDEGFVNKLQLFSRLTYISISLNPNFYTFYKSKYLNLVSNSTFLSDMHRNTHQLNSKIMESMFLFKQAKYDEMLTISIPQLDIDNYIFEGTLMHNYVDLLFARGATYFKLNNLDKAFDYFNFIIDNKAKLKTKAFYICNAFFHLWLIRYISREYKVLKSISNRYKIYLNKNNINYDLEKSILKFMTSVGNNLKRKNIIKNIENLLNQLEVLKANTIEKHWIDELEIIRYLAEFEIHE